MESILVNSNPEMVSANHDTSDKLQLEPLTWEDVLHILQGENPMVLIVRFGRQTSFNPAVPRGGPEGFPRRPLCKQGRWNPLGKVGHQSYAGQVTARYWFCGRNRTMAHPCEGGGLSFFTVSQRRHFVGAGNEVHGRSHGHRPQFRLGLCQGSVCRRVRSSHGGTVFISVRDSDKSRVLPVAREFIRLGFRLIATRGTAGFLKGQGLEVGTVFKLREGRPHVVDRIKSGDIHLVANTSLGKKAFSDSYVQHPPCHDHVGARAMALAVEELQRGQWDVRTLQEYHSEIHKPS